MTDLKELQPLLDYRTLLLPDDLDGEAYRNFLWAFKVARELYPTKRLKLYCHGNGGDANIGFALVDLIQQDGRVDGILLGGAYSSHSVVWASCARRFCYPLAGIGVHNCISSSNSWEDTSYRKTDAHKMTEFDRAIAKIYSAASNKDIKWWLDKMARGHSACYWIEANKLAKIGMTKILINKRK